MPSDPRGGMAYCRRAARASGSNFYYALWLLPPARRDAMFAVYSFCRAVDDVVDSGAPVELAQQELERWRQEIARCYDERPAHPVTQALAPVVRRYQVPQSLFTDIVTGMSWDLTPRRYATFAELEQYCYYVAGAVGLIAIRIFGCRQPQSETFARQLGLAFQLTNILRDLAEDAAQDRVYLPQEDVKKFQVSERDFQGLSPAGTVPERVRTLLAFEGTRARQAFAAARAAITRADRRALTPALAMAAVYERLLDQIAAARFDVFSHPIQLPKLQKLSLAVRGAFLRG